MKRLRPDIPIVMLSAHDDLTVDELQNTDTYLVKGNDSSALFATLARLTAPAMSHRSVQGLQRAA
jgi:two-component SAPR family response regulator